MTDWWDRSAPTPVSPPTETPVPTGVTNTEPVVLGGALMGVVSATFAVLIEFDVWHPTEHQTSLLMQLITSLAIFVTVLVRGKVSSPASVARALKERG